MARHALLADWSADPVLIGSVLLVVALYAAGVSRTMSGDSAAGPLSRRLAFAGAILALIIASCSPIDYFAAELFWVHMIQHLLLLAVVAPLVVAAAPWAPVWNALAPNMRSALRRVYEWKGAMSRAWTALRRPRVSLAVLILGTWFWHWPPLYDAALGNEILHDYGEHLTFLIVGVLFWLQLMPSAPLLPTLRLTGRGLYLLAATVQNVLLSVVLGFAQVPLYAPYAALVQRPGGISALADQQIGSAIMWSFGDLPFLVALAVVIHLWLREQMQEPLPDVDRTYAETKGQVL